MEPSSTAVVGVLSRVGGDWRVGGAKMRKDIRAKGQIHPSYCS